MQKLIIFNGVTMKQGLLYVFILCLSGWLTAQDITYRVVERSPYCYTELGDLYIDYSLNDYKNECKYVEPGTIIKYDIEKNYYYAGFAFGGTTPKDWLFRLYCGKHWNFVQLGHE